MAHDQALRLRCLMSGEPHKTSCSSHLSHQRHNLLQVDLIYYPFAERFALAMPKFAGLDMHGTSQAVSGWLGVMEGRPAVQMASPKADLFLAALTKEKSLDFFDFKTYKADQLLPHIKVSNS